MSEIFAASTRVRIISDPGRVGVVTRNTRQRGDELLIQVVFPEGAQYVPLSYIEPVREGGDDPLDLLKRGRFSHPPDLRRTLTHARLAGRLADVIYSMDTTGTDFYAYQFKPLVKLLNSATTGMLIADEVGLGKTIEAGLIWTELRSRFDYDRLLVLCPAMLRNKWRRELKTRFGVDAGIVDAGELRETLKQASIDPDFSRFALIASLQGARPRKGWRDEDEQRGQSSELARMLDGSDHQEPLVDLTIIDEAHYLRNAETMTSELGRLIRGVSSHIILLSATPVHLKSDDLYQLVRLADPDTFDRASAFNEVLESNAPLVAACDLIATGSATREDIEYLLLDALTKPLLRGNRQITSLIQYLQGDVDISDPKTAGEIGYRLETANLLGHVVTRMRRREVQEWRVIRKVKTESVPMTPVEQAFYDAVTGIVRSYCAQAGALEDFLLVMPQRQISSSMPAAFKSWSDRNPWIHETAEQDFDDDFEDDFAEERLGPLVAELVRSTSSVGNFELLKKNDSKYARLKTVLTELFRRHPDAKVVLFSYFKPTLDYLYARLGEDGIASLVLHGDTPDKDSVVETFKGAESGLVLLSSEVASEGIDLQFSWAMVNYDLPWNPMRVEQRIGRIDRLGQKAETITIWNLFYKGTIDDRIYNRLYSRLKLFEKTLGGLEPILGREIRVLAMDLFRKELAPDEEEARIAQTERAFERTRQEEERLESEAAHLVAHGDYILRQVNAARELSRRIGGDDLRWYVTEFFKQHYPGCEFRQVSGDHCYEVTLSSDARADLDGFLTEKKLRARTRLAQVNASRVPCQFENSVLTGDGTKREIVSQFHPIVRFVSRRIEEKKEAAIRPAVAIGLTRAALADLELDLGSERYVFAVQRWSMRGLQDVEYLYYVAAPMDTPEQLLADEEAEKLVGAAAMYGKDWLTAQADVDCEAAYDAINERCLSFADSSYEKRILELQARNEDRAEVQERTLLKHRDSQIARKTEILESQLRRGLGIANATEGQINAIRERSERKQREINERRKLSKEKIEICVGVIRIVD